MRILPLTGADAGYDPLLTAIGDAAFVLLGEASHGTHEFYRERARITRRLIAEKGFSSVAVEADWPDAYRVNRYVRRTGDDGSAVEALADFERFPAWMWRNTDVLDFVGWLRDYNASLPRNSPRAGFYGLDLYSLYASMEAVVQYLDRVDPKAARRARQRYACFEDFGEDAQAYGYSASAGLTEPCEPDVVNQLVELQKRTAEYARRDGHVAADEFFYAEQNARLVRNAETYYRSLFRGRASSWNLRDQHMTETLENLANHLSRAEGRTAKLVVWAHNSHLGDARATDMGRSGEWNVGQLVRERHPGAAALVGFTTYTGTVTAASDWGGPPERKRVRPALAGTYEAFFHDSLCKRLQTKEFLMVREEGDRRASMDELRGPRLERAIGVIYRPETERLSHYFRARLPEQFDAVIHVDETRAVEPLEREAMWETGEVWETFPEGV